MAASNSIMYSFVLTQSRWNHLRPRVARNQHLKVRFTCLTLRNLLVFSYMLGSSLACVLKIDLHTRPRDESRSLPPGICFCIRPPACIILNLARCTPRPVASTVSGTYRFYLQLHFQPLHKAVSESMSIAPFFDLHWGSRSRLRNLPL
jgi:hypothetical protein